MILNVSGLNIFFEQYLNSSGRVLNAGLPKKNLFLFHGFTGSSKDWSYIIPYLSKNFNYYAIDLPGHGNSDSPQEKSFYRTNSLVEIIKEVINKITSGEIFLAGYSMGGRAALSYSIKYPETIRGLILESSTAGIKNVAKRKERIEKDEELSCFIENHSIEEFVDYWMNMEIFNTQKRFSNSKLQQIKKLKMNNNKTGLANFLRGFGTGQMPDYSRGLKNLNFKTLLITGELDEKFTSINRSFLNLFPSAKHIIIKNSGHNTHLETPEAFIKVVNKFLDQFKTIS